MDEDSGIVSPRCDRVDTDARGLPSDNSTCPVLDRGVGPEDLSRIAIRLDDYDSLQDGQTGDYRFRPFFSMTKH